MLTKFETKSARVKGKHLPAADSTYANVSRSTDDYHFQRNRLLHCFVFFCIDHTVLLLHVFTVLLISLLEITMSIDGCVFFYR